MATLSACIQGIGLLGPGLNGWAGAVAVLQGELPYRAARTVLPLPQMLPPTERRRAGRITRLALSVGAEAVAHAAVDARTLPTVFTSSGGDGDNCHEICRSLASNDRQLSPTRFHNSVHNAPAGYWGIAYGCTAASSALCGHDASFGAGLLEALAQLHGGAEAVLLLAYDADYPQPLHAKRPIPDAFGVALALAPATSARALALVRIGLSAAAATPMAEPALEALRAAVPAARCLPLLECLARRRSRQVVLDYLDGARLAVDVEVEF
jgi:hypothetical protein